MTVIRGRRRAFFLLALISSASAIFLPEKYDNSIRPNDGGVGDVVNVSMDILRVRDINEDEQNMSVDLLLRTFWADKRLENIVERETVFASNGIPQVWIPHLSIRNSRESSISDQSLKLKMDGTLEHTQRISVTLNCPVSSWKYPFGHLECQLQLSSNGYSTIHLMLIWHGLISQDVPTFDPEYQFSSLDQSSGRRKTESGEFSFVYVDIIMSRCALRVITRAFLPTLLFTSLAFYVTFFLRVGQSDNSRSEEDPNGEEDGKNLRGPLSRRSKKYFDFLRATINVICLVAVVFIGEINFLKSPRSAAITGLDVWAGVMGFVIFICFILSLRICFNEAEVGDGKVTEKVANILKVGIPVVFVVFLITYGGIYLS